MINPFRIDAYHKTFSTVLALGQITGSNEYGKKACAAIRGIRKDTRYLGNLDENELHEYVSTYGI